MEKNIHITAFDEETQTHQLEMLKTILPYVQWNSRYPMAMFIKILELKNVMKIFSNPSPTLSICEEAPANGNAMQLLHDLAEIATEEERQNIEQIIQTYEMIENYRFLFQTEQATS